MKTQTLEPFKHDCPSCEWIGWIQLAHEGWANIYICKNGTLVFRYGNEPKEYLSMSKGSIKGSLRVC